MAFGERPGMAATVAMPGQESAAQTGDRRRSIAMFASYGVMRHDTFSAESDRKNMTSPSAIRFNRYS